jgi:hypothetical protein
MWDLWWTKWHWEGFCSECFVFPRSVPSHQCPILIFTYKLLSSQVQTGKAWEPSKKQRSFGSLGTLGRGVLSAFSYLMWLNVVAVLMWEENRLFWECILKHNQQDATLYNIHYYCQGSTCFKRFFCPSSGAQICTCSIGCLPNLFAATAIMDDPC